MQLTSERRRLLTLVGIALFLQLFYLTLPLGGWIKGVLFLLWAGVIPGHLLAEVIGREFGAPPTRLEWGLYAVGAGYPVILGVTGLLRLFPDAIQMWHVLVGVDGLLLLLAMVAWPIAGRDAAPTAPLPAKLLAVVGVLGMFAGGVYLWHDIPFPTLLAPAPVGLAAVFAPATLLLTPVVTQLLHFAAHVTALAAAYWLGWRVGDLLDLPAAARTFLEPALPLAVFVVGVTQGYTHSVPLLMFVLATLTAIRLAQRAHGLAGGVALAALYGVTGLWAALAASF
jgi:hypothetical protein